MYVCTWLRIRRIKGYVTVSSSPAGRSYASASPYQTHPHCKYIHVYDLISKGKIAENFKLQTQL